MNEQSVSEERDRLLLSRFAARIEGFNQRRQSLRDLCVLCDQHEIEIVRYPLRRLHGAALDDSTCRYIYINQYITEPQKIIAGFHEFAHIMEHVFDASLYKSAGSLWNLSKIERQAQLIGVVALMPWPLIAGRSEAELMHEFRMPRQAIRFRLTHGMGQHTKLRCNRPKPY